MGVDVFFVISGFLITSVIDREIAASDFSVVRFYERRIRRIFPALFAVLLSVILLAALVLLPQDRRKIVTSAVAATLFASNFVFWKRTGYFERGAEADPLLHTWSLAVEEQFYLVFPVLLFLLSRYAARWRAHVLAGLGLLSLAGSAWAAHAAPEAGFFLLPTRFWELMLGALLALRPFRAPGWLSLAGLGAIAFGVATYSSLTPFPGVAALAPCVGTLLVIAAGPEAAANRVLSWRPLVFVGLISYSLYLWHWPVLVFARYYAFALLGRDPAASDLGLLMALSIALAVLSWRFVERPFRDRQRFSDPAILRLGVALMAATCALAWVVVSVRGLPERRVAALETEPVRVIDQYPCVNRNDARLKREGLCTLGAPNGSLPPFVLWGDSHANALAPALDLAAQRIGRPGAYATRGGCPPLLDVEVLGMVQCRDAWDRSFFELVERGGYRTVVIAGRWAMYGEAGGYGSGTDGGMSLHLRDAETQEVSRDENRRVLERSLERTLNAFEKRGVRVVLVGPVPEVGRSVPATLARLQLLGRERAFGPTRDEFEARSGWALGFVERVAAAHGAELVLPHERLCASGRCATAIGREPLYEDDDHLSVLGSRSLADLFQGPLSRP